MSEDGSAAVDRLFSRALRARSRGQPGAARVLVLQALTLAPRKLRLLIELADCEKELGDLSAALRSLRRAERVRPDSATVQLRIGIVQLELGRPKLAERALRRALELEPSAPAHNLLFAVLSRQGREAEGEPHLRAALRLDPRNEEAHCNLGICYRKRRQLARAERHLRSAIEIDPGYQVAYAELGEVLLMRGQHAEARRALRKAVRLRPEAYWARLYLAQASQELRRLKEAEDQYREALELRPEDPLGHALYGEFLSVVRGRPVDAESCLHTAVMLDPRDATAQYHMGKHLCRTGRDREGRKHLRRAARFGDARALTLLERARA